MKRNLLTTTGLTPPRVVYDPVTATIAGALGIPAGSIGYAVLGVGVSIGVNAIASAALSAIAGQPERPSMGFLLNDVDPVAYAQYLLGERRIGGTVTYEETTEDGRVLHRIIVLGAEEFDNIGDIYLNDEKVTLSDDSYSLTDPSDDTDVYTGAGWVTTEKWMEKNTVREPRIRILKHRGNQTAVTDAFANSATATMANTLIAESAVLDSTFVGNDMAFLYVRANLDAEVFATGMPVITADCRGSKVYDPRTDTVGFTRNWALNISHFLNADWGFGGTGTVNDTALSVEANICDGDIALAGGGTQKRYELNGVIRADENPGEVLAKMLRSGVGTAWWGQDQWRIRSAYYTGPVDTFDAGDLLTDLTLMPKPSLSESFNSVRGKFHDAAQRYIPGEYTPVTSSVFEAEDGGRENPLDWDLPFEVNGIRAQRCAKLKLYRNREQIRWSAGYPLRALEYEPGDVIAQTYPLLGWDEKEGEIEAFSLTLENKGPAEDPDIQLGVYLTLQETSEAAFDWNADETVFSANNTTLVDSRAVPSVALGAPVVSYVKNPGGTEMPLVTVPWTVSGQGYARDFVFEWRENTIDYAGLGGFVTLSSPTAREQAVYDAYLAGLGRVPDQNGFDFYVSGGGAALTAAEVLADITDSAEGAAQDTYQSTVVRTRRAELRSLSVGKYYDLSVYARNARGNPSDKSRTTYLVTPDTVAPPVPTYTGKAITVVGNVVTLRWNNPDTDGGGLPVHDLAFTEIWRGASATLTLDGNGDPTNATLIGRSTTDEYIDTSPDYENTYYYFERARDYAKNVSDFAAGREVTTGAEIVDGVNGVDGNSIAQLVVYRRAASAPATPTGGSFDFDTKVLTPPSGWSIVPPVGTDTLYSSLTTAAVEGTSGVDNALTWSTPAASGVDGVTGKSTYQAVVFRRASSTPATPTGGSFNFGTEVLTPPSGWSVSPPAGSDPLYATRYLFSVSGDTGTDTAGTWSAPAIFVRDGADGVSTFHIPIYRRATSIPATPTGGSYDFDTQILTPPSGWSATVPSGTDPLYISTAVASIQGTVGVDNTLTWSTVREIARNGTTGDRGAGRWWIGVSSLPSASLADDRWNDGSGTRPTRPVVGDQAIFYTGTQANPTATRAFICASVTSDTVHTWTEQVVFIDGNATIAGTLTLDKLAFFQGSSIEVSGGTIFVRSRGITSGLIALNGVEDANIGNDQIQNRHIDTAAVDTAEIASLAVTKADDFQDDTPGGLSELPGNGAYQTVIPASAIAIPANTTASILFLTSFQQGYTSGARQWGFRLYGKLNSTSFTGSDILLERSGMNAINDFPTVQTLAETISVSSSGTYYIRVDWYGQDSTIKLQKVITSTFFRYR